jgi:hypothetical protein
MLKKTDKFILVFCVLSAIVYSASPAAACLQFAIPGVWVIETIDTGPGDENNPSDLRYPSLAIDSAGVAQVVYSRGLESDANNPLVYARKNISSWVTQTLETSGEKPSLVLSSQQQPRLAFFDFAADESLVFRNLDIAGGFRSVVITNTGTSQVSTDLALDTAGEPVIAFTQKTVGITFTLGLASRIGGNWVITDIAQNAGGVTSLAVDSANRVHLSYQDGLSRTVIYTTRTPTGWVTETVGNPDTLNFAILNSIAVDSADTPHLVYVKYSAPPELIYAKRMNTGWVTETIASGANLEFSFALDKDGNPHVAYIDPITLRKPTYAVRANNTWLTAIASNDAAAYISLALGPSGQPAIAYTDFDTGHLKLARLIQAVYLPLLFRL